MRLRGRRSKRMGPYELRLGKGGVPKLIIHKERLPRKAKKAYKKRVMAWKKEWAEVAMRAVPYGIGLRAQIENKFNV